LKGKSGLSRAAPCPRGKTFSTNKLQNQDCNETEDFTGYIKEWVKSM